LHVPVKIEWWTGSEETKRMRDSVGEILHPGERVFICVTNTAGPGNVWVNVFDVGMSRKITLLNTSEPSGLELAPGTSYTIGCEPVFRAAGLPLSWPKHLPVSGPRIEAIVAIFADAPQDLRRLQTDGVRARQACSRATAIAPSGLKALLEGMTSGTREFAGAAEFQSVRYQAKHIEFMVTPGGRHA
jgi:hypothetical protein